MRRYFIVSHRGEAKLIFWNEFYNPDGAISDIMRNRYLEYKEVNSDEADTMGIIGGVPRLHVTEVGNWIKKKRWRE
jgi:hypothetical protein